MANLACGLLTKERLKPKRAEKFSFQQFAEVFGDDRQVSCCREISKLHEESIHIEKQTASLYLAFGGMGLFFIGRLQREQIVYHLETFCHELSFFISVLHLLLELFRIFSCQYDDKFAPWFCSLMMLIGRLEIFSVLVILTPAFWREN